VFMEKLKLDGRVAVVTGGGRSIGLSCCLALAEAGAKVVIADFDSAVAESGRAEMKKAGFDADVALMDVTKSDQVEKAAGDIEKRHGRVDILVANAGIARSGTAAESVPDELWLNVNDVNLNGVFWTNRSFGKRMIARKSGAIVNIGSMSGYIVNWPQKQSYYNASKAAVHHLTRSLATEWAEYGVRVNAVAPTYIDTALLDTVKGAAELKKIWISDTPMQRLGKPEEIASVVHFLASDASSLLTGSIVLADGGFTSW
jgi:NAD(P)-dependent dehydrogenase (short-subunit alcohol dehydrogenase family)